MKNTTTELILHNREENSKLMEKLNLSPEFEKFKVKQENKHQNTMKKINKAKTMFLTATLAGAAGFSITRLAEHFYKNNFEHSYGAVMYSLKT